jgi:glycosyltransferase involved in cell wall biosynthesis
MNNPLLSIVVPIFNEEELLPEVLRRVRAIGYSPIELVLVDDASTDGTPAILREESKRPNTIVLTHEVNQGKGAAIRTGLEHTSGEIIIIQDADLEYDPNDIIKVVAPILTGKTDVTFGSRFLGKVEGMALPNLVANHLLAWLVSILFGQRITDEATAYKCFRHAVLDEFSLTCRRFEFCPEFTAKALKHGHRVIEVPVSFKARTVLQGKKIGWRDFFIAVYTILRIRFFERKEQKP